MLLGIHDSDGHGWNIKGRTNNIVTISEKLKEQLCYLGTMLGYHVRFDKKKISNMAINGRQIKSNKCAWNIYWSNIRHPIFPKSTVTNYDGKIWCLKVKDNKNFLVERNGKTFFSGNTDEVYGHLESEDAPSWTEDASLNPRNPYSATKAAGEMLVRAAHKSHGLNYNITRSSNNYGPRQTPDKLLPKVIKNILQGSPIPVYGQGLQVRDWTHVFDNCSAVLKIIEKGEPNETYNISANQELSNIEVVQKVCNVMKDGHSLISFVKDRPGHDFRYSIDSSKIKALGWKPEYTFPAGIEQTIFWYTNNQWYLK